MQIEDIEQKITSQINCEHLAVQGDGRHFQALVVSDEFSGLSRIKRQQLVYAAVQEWITSGKLHALSLKTLTVDEWKING